jgi:hypothetical protein
LSTTTALDCFAALRVRNRAAGRFHQAKPVNTARLGCPVGNTHLKRRQEGELALRSFVTSLT